MNNTLDRKKTEALPAIIELRQAQETMRLLSDDLYELNEAHRECGRIVLARASWHLDNRVTALCQAAMDAEAHYPPQLAG